MRRWISVASATLLVAVGLVSGAGTAYADDSHCPDGYACFWTGDQFGGNKVLRGAEWYGYGWQPFDNAKASVKNRFSNKTVWIYSPYLPGDGVDCGFPGQRAQVPGITWFAISHDCGGRLVRYFRY